MPHGQLTPASNRGTSWLIWAQFGVFVCKRCYLCGRGCVDCALVSLGLWWWWGEGEGCWVTAVGRCQGDVASVQTQQMNQWADFSSHTAECTSAVFIQWLQQRKQSVCVTEWVSEGVFLLAVWFSLCLQYSPKISRWRRNSVETAALSSRSSFLVDDLSIHVPLWTETTIYNHEKAAGWRNWTKWHVLSVCPSISSALFNHSVTVDTTNTPATWRLCVCVWRGGSARGRISYYK